MSHEKRVLSIVGFFDPSKACVQPVSRARNVALCLKFSLVPCIV